MVFVCFTCGPQSSSAGDAMQMGKMAPNLTLGKKSAQERLPGGLIPELYLKEGISCKCLPLPPVREPWESRAVIFHTWLQALDECFLEEIRNEKITARGILLSPGNETLLWTDWQPTASASLFPVLHLFHRFLLGTYDKVPCCSRS